MKTLLLSLSLAAAMANAAQAEIYRPSVVADSTVLGAVAGALIGGHNHDHWAAGALIGAAAGAVVGNAVDPYQPREYREYRQTEIAPVVQVSRAPVVVSEPPQLVYVPATSPRVVYVQTAPRPVFVVRPFVSISSEGYYHRRFHGGWNGYYRGW
jgi:hypothetical protein